MGIPGREELKRLKEQELQKLRFAKDALYFARFVNLWLQLSALDMEKQAAQLAKELPRDINLLTRALYDESIPIERRAKVLEVMIYRGATNDASYAAMDSFKKFAAERAAFGDGLEITRQFVDREKEFAERRRYQEAVRDVILRSPNAGAELFNQLSKSPDQLPQGRSGATEFMNTMLRNGGLYGTDDSRQEFEKEMLKLPAETRGRMMYHLLDAGQSSDIHLKGERRETGWGVEVSFDTGGGGLGLGFSKSWDYVPDNHWREAGKDITRQMNADLQGRTQEFLNAHEKGLKDAAALDKGPSPN